MGCFRFLVATAASTIFAAGLAAGQEEPSSTAPAAGKSIPVAKPARPSVSEESQDDSVTPAATSDVEKPFNNPVAPPPPEAARPRPKRGKLAAGIVGRVDDSAILLEDIIGPARGRLQQAQQQLPPEQYKKVEREMLKQLTQNRIEQLVVLKELQLKVKQPEVIARVREAANQDFEKYLLKIGKDAGLGGRDEVVKRLESEGSDIEELRVNFVDNILAQQFLQMMIKPSIREYTRNDLVKYYRDHIDEFRTEAGAVWRHIEFRYGKDREAAKAKADVILARLRQGEDFANLAKAHSEGPLASEGGLWSLTSKGSYADKAVDAVLFSIPVGEISGLIEGQKSYHIVRVENRNDGAPKPFPEVQDEIRRRLQNETLAELRRDKIKELIEKHHIETVFDNDSESLEQIGARDRLPKR